MRSVISRWFMFGLLLGWAISHATVFAQGNASSTPAQPPQVQPQPPAGTVERMSVEKIRQGLDKTITINYTGQNLHDVLNHFRERSGLAINVDQMAFMQMGLNGDIPMPQVEVKAKNEKAGAVLRRLLNGHRMNYVILEDSLLVTTEDSAVVRQMRQRVNVEVEEVPLKKAVQELAKKHGINLVIDPLVKQTVDTPVTLQLDNTGVETALRLLAEMANLKAIRMGNVMFITNEAKAKKIREEEAHQLDNPLNPNLPFGGPAIAIDGIGGRFMGGVGRAAPGIAVPDGPVPVPPPGIDLPKAIPQQGGGDDPVQSPPAKKVIDVRPGVVPPAPPIPQPAPAVDLPLRQAIPAPRNRE